MARVRGNNTLIVVGLLGVAAYALIRARSGAINLFGAPVTMREQAVSSWISSLPPEVDWRLRPEFNKPDTLGDIARASILGAASAFIPIGGQLMGAAVASQDRR